MRLPKLRRGQRNSTSADVTTAVRQLVLIANDDLIAGILNRNGLTTGNGNRWTRERVTSMRSNYRIPVFKPTEDGIEPWLNLSMKTLSVGLPRPGEVERDIALISPQVEIARDELGALIDPDCLPEPDLPADLFGAISTTSGPRKVNRGSIAGEKRENVSMIVSTRNLRPVAS